MTTSPEPAPAVPPAFMLAESRDESTLVQIGTQLNVLPALPAAPEVRYSLPADTAAFTGRSEELGQITVAVTGNAGGVVPVGAIDGMPGVGKTALAVHAAHALRARFPDRQLFINLHGHTPGREPVRPEDALAGLLAAVGVDPRCLPGDLDGRAGMWRDRMAGQRALLLLDNAASSSQVTPLLPGGEGCAVLVTSRRHLGDLPGVVMTVLLNALSPQQAADMFTRLAPRSAASPGEVAEVVPLAGFLPLAISLLARVHARHPAWSLTDLGAETQARLLTMSAERDSVAAAFEVSFRHLDGALQELFCALGQHPGASVDAYAAAAVCEIGLDEAARRLDALHGEGLLTETGYRRYGMHDLIRRYAADLVPPGSAQTGRDVLGRLMDYYARAAADTEAQLGRRWASTRPARPPSMTTGPTSQATLPDQGDDARALAWARAERANLLACIDHAARTGQDSRVVALTAGITALLRRDGPHPEAAALHAAAAQAAARLNDRADQADALISLGNQRWLAADYHGAATALNEALGIYRGLGDRPGHGIALMHLSHLWLSMGDVPAARQAFEAALATFTGLGDRLGETNALRGLGIAAYLSADYVNAGRLLSRALELSRDLGDRPSEANALHGLGIARLLSADYSGAARALAAELDIVRELGDRLSLANALIGLGSVQRETGNYAAAARSLSEAYDISREVGSRSSQASALSGLGAVLHLSGAHLDAEQALAEALATFRATGSKLGEAYSLRILGAVRRAIGDRQGAGEALAHAREISLDIGDREGHAETLNETGILQLDKDEPAAAADTFRQALELAQEISTPHAEAAALAGLGRCAVAAGRDAEARILLTQAQQTFQRIGAAEAGAVLSELDVLARSGRDRQP